MKKICYAHVYIAQYLFSYACTYLGTTTSNMTLCLSVTVLLLILERMPCQPAVTSTQPMVPTPLEPWATAAMEALITRSEVNNRLNSLTEGGNPLTSACSYCQFTNMLMEGVFEVQFSMYCFLLYIVRHA